MAKGSNTFGGTIKLEGEKEYRDAISNIDSSLKVMGSELTKVTAEYGKNNTSTEALTAKNKVLSETMEKQKEKINQYEEAVKKLTSQQSENEKEHSKLCNQYDEEFAKLQSLANSSNATSIEIEKQEKIVSKLSEEMKKSESQYEANNKKIDTWKVSLNKAEADLFNMKNDLDSNNKTMEEGSKVTDENSKSIKKLGTEADTAGQKSLSLGDIIKANLISDAIKSGFKALANGISSVTSAMTGAITQGASYADNMLTLSTQTGVSAENLQKYSAVAELVDVSTETMTASMAKNIKQMSSGNDAYKTLGVSLKDANGNLRDSNDVYWESIDALGKIENETERDALAMSIFGKSAQDLNPLIAQGSQGIQDLGDEAVRMGAVLSDDALKALGDVDDEMQIFKTTTSATGNILASAFAPAVASLIGSVNDLGAGFNYLISSIVSGDEGGIEEASQMMSDSVQSMVNNIAEQLPQILDIVSNLLTTIGEVIVENLPTIIEGGVKILTSLINGITSALPQILPAIVQAVLTIVQGIINNLPTILQAGITVIVELIKGLAQALPQLIPAIVDAVILMVETLIDNIDLIIDAGIQIIFGLIDGLIEAMPKLIDKIPEIIDKLIMAITNNLPKLIEAGITLIIKLAEGLIKAIPQLISKIPQIIGSLISGIANYFGKMSEMGGNLLGKVKDGIVNGISGMLDIGKNLVQGLWNGISNATQWVLDKIKGFGTAILNGIKSIFGIHSPSRVFRDEVGKNLALGLGEGFEDEMDSVTSDMQKALPTDFDLGVNGNLENNITTNTKVSGSSEQDSKISILKEAFKEAIKELKGDVILDDEVAGKFVVRKVEEVVYN